MSHQPPPTDQSPAPSPGPGERYDISAVSRFTGLSTPNIRIWEKRYDVVTPERTESRRRLYSRNDINRLTLLKTLVDRGHSISSIADLDTDQLERRLSEDINRADPTRPASKPAEIPSELRRVAIAGSTLSELVRSEEHRLRAIEITDAFPSIEKLRVGLLPGEADVLLIECPTFFEDTAAAIQELVAETKALRAIIVYRYARKKALHSVDRQSSAITALRAPVNLTEILLACAAEASPAGEAANPPLDADSSVRPRLFTDRQLAALTQATSKVECECPQHLAGLLASLNAFEVYSLQCEDRNPQDAELHDHLHRATARARSLMEEALQHLIDTENISLSRK